MEFTRWGGEARGDVSENKGRWERSECVDYRKGEGMRGGIVPPFF